MGPFFLHGCCSSLQPSSCLSLVRKYPDMATGQLELPKARWGGGLSHETTDNASYMCGPEGHEGC